MRLSDCIILMQTDHDYFGNDMLCPVWNDDQWLKQHSGATLEKTEEGETEEGNTKRSQEEVDNVCDTSKQFFPKLGFK